VEVHLKHLLPLVNFILNQKNSSKIVSFPFHVFTLFSYQLLMAMENKYVLLSLHVHYHSVLLQPFSRLFMPNYSLVNLK
jgi:hypothetical protein